eukprot:m.260686 g.260686  ORF g.260686 m.260686 type:complete len:57 (+) comp40436_c0_seq1:1779-1949(+)
MCLFSPSSSQPSVCIHLHFFVGETSTFQFVDFEETDMGLDFYTYSVLQATEICTSR